VITVLVPMHGESPFIKFTLDSIYQQALSTNFELLLVFDRVPEYRKNFVKKYSENFPTKFYDSTQPGLVPALNLGINNTDSKYIARIDADDLMLENRLQIQLDFMELNDNVSVLGSQVEYINELNVTIGYSNYPTSYKSIRRELPWNCCLAHPSAMLRTETLKKHGGYSNKFKHAEDYELWLRMFESTEIRNLSGVLTKYRISSNQVSRVFRFEQIHSTAQLQKSFHLFTSKKSEQLRKSIKFHNLNNVIVFSKIYSILLNLRIDLRTLYLISKIKNKSLKFLVYGLLLCLIHPKLVWFRVYRAFDSTQIWHKFIWRVRKRSLR
jgi:glycosyltransferase involved in cell wall biosynthesis